MTNRISIRGARAHRRLTQKQVAAELGVSLPTYGLMERDPSRITWAQAKKLARILGRDIEDLAFFTDEEAEQQADEPHACSA